MRIIDDPEIIAALEELLGWTPENIQQKIDERLARFAAMSEGERRAHFRKSMYPKPLEFTKEIDGTTYTVNAFFNDGSNETIPEMVERIVSDET